MIALLLALVVFGVTSRHSTGSRRSAPHKIPAHRVTKALKKAAHAKKAPHVKAAKKIKPPKKPKAPHVKKAPKAKKIKSSAHSNVRFSKGTSKETQAAVRNVIRTFR